MKHHWKWPFGGLLACLLLSACHSISDRPSSSTAASRPLALPPEFGETAAPASANEQQDDAAGRPPVFSVPHVADLPMKKDDIPLDPQHTFTLPELIDLAQRNNPETRIAWERARQAALSVGLVESSYLPELSAEVLGGYQRTPLPIPKTLVPRGYFTADTQEAVPGLVVRWLLFDFGRRDAMKEGAQQLSLAADIGFNGTHQKLIFEVAKAYFAVDAERSQRRVAEAAVKNAQILENAVMEKQAHGLATVPEVAQARRYSAKARFDLEMAKAADNDAYHTLQEAIGITPTVRLELADSAGRRLPKALGETADVMTQRALARRPDIVATLAKLKASEANVAAAHASYYPTVALEGAVARNLGGISIDNGPTYRVNETAAGFLLQLKLPLYDGNFRDRTLAIAVSKQSEAREELAKAEDVAVHQIARAHDALNSALAQYDAAEVLASAAATSAEAALDAYRQGVGTFTVASTAETDRAQAQSAHARAYAGVLSAAAALAFATGELTSGAVLE